MGRNPEEKRFRGGYQGMIELQQVSVHFPAPTRQVGLDGVSLKVERGEFVFLVGPSGAGKSTLMRLLYREERPTAGRVMVLGEELGHLSARKIALLRRQVGVIFQDFRLLPDRTVFENVAFALRVIEAGPREIRRRVPAMLEMVGLLGKSKSFPHELSGGEQQRAALARALVGRPPLLLADEPTGNLDPKAAASVVQVLHEINLRGTTVVMATHAKSVVDSMQRRVVAIHKGRVVRDERQGGYDEAAGGGL